MKRLVHLCARKSRIDWRRRANKGGRGWDWTGLEWKRLDWMWWATRAVLFHRAEPGETNPSAYETKLLS